MPSTGDASRPGPRQIADGLVFVATHPSIRAVLLTDLAATVLSMPLSLFPLLNQERFDGSPRTLGLFLSALAVGGVVASLLSGTFTRLPRPGLVMVTAAATWGGALALAGIASGWGILALLVLAGAADTVSVVSRSTVVQGLTPDAMLGRTAAAEMIVGQAGPDLGNLRAGLVASAWSGTVALATGGVMCVAAVVAIAATTPDLRRRQPAAAVPDQAGSAVKIEEPASAAVPT